MSMTSAWKGCTATSIATPERVAIVRSRRGIGDGRQRSLGARLSHRRAPPLDRCAEAAGSAAPSAPSVRFRIEPRAKVPAAQYGGDTAVTLPAADTLWVLGRNPMKNKTLTSAVVDLAA